MKMRIRRRTYYYNAYDFRGVVWSRWERKILCALPPSVIHLLRAEGRSNRWIADWATQPCVWVDGWPAPVATSDPEIMFFAATVTLRELRAEQEY
jgi:hypothetical protein